MWHFSENGLETICVCTGTNLGGILLCRVVTECKMELSGTTTELNDSIIIGRYQTYCGAKKRTKFEIILSFCVFFVYLTDFGK